jgi:predicted DNA-binding transcriptional regulator AlpA
MHDESSTVVEPLLTREAVESATPEAAAATTHLISEVFHAHFAAIRRRADRRAFLKVWYGYGDTDDEMLLRMHERHARRDNPHVSYQWTWEFDDIYILSIVTWKTGLSRQKVLRMVSAGDFPPEVRPHRPMELHQWDRFEVEEWLGVRARKEKEDAAAKVDERIRSLEQQIDTLQAERRTLQDEKQSLIAAFDIIEKARST